MQRSKTVIIFASAVAVLLLVAYVLVMQGVFARVASVSTSPASSVASEQAVAQDVPMPESSGSAEVASLVSIVEATPPVAATVPVERSPTPAASSSPRQVAMIAAGYTADEAVIAESLIYDSIGMWRMDATGPRLAIETAATPDERFSIAAQYVHDRYGSWAGAQAHALASNGRW